LMPSGMFMMVIGILVVLLPSIAYQPASDLDHWMEYMRELFYT